MGRGDYLGEFEQLVLLALARLDGDSYGMEIRREIEATARRHVAIGAVYATLERLEGKGLVRARHQQTGGRAKRFFAMSAPGVAALEQSREIQTRMWRGLELKRAGRRS